MRVLSTLPTLVLLLATGAFSQDVSSADVSSSSPTPTASGDSATTASSSTTSSTASSTGYPDSDLDPVTRCRQNEIVAGPFCAPKPHDVWHTDGTYYVTWDSDRWNANSTCYLTLNYLTPGSKGNVAKEYQFPNARGFLTIIPEQEWLLNQTLHDQGTDVYVDEQTLYLIMSNDDVSTPGARGPYTGPNIILSAKIEPTPIDTSPNNRPPPSFLGLAVGLPLVFVFILFAVCGTHFCMKNKRRIGPIAIGGGARRFKKGYSGRAARRQRAHVGGGASYRDDPDEEEEERSVPDLAPAAQRREWELASVKGGRESGGM